jgi:DNA polymerase (family 10)
MQNSEIARQFEQLADLLEIDGANPFRLRAYRNAARTISGQSAEVAALAGEGRAALMELPGIGKDLAEKIEQIVETGELPQLVELKERIPAGILDMLRLPGMGPKKVAVLFHDLGLETLDALKAAAEEGRVSELKGFGKKTEQTILANIDRVAEAGLRSLLADAKPAAEQIVADLLRLKSVRQAAVAGSCRRCRETVGDLDVLVTAAQSQEAMDRLAGHELVSEVLARGETKQRVRLKSGIELDLRVVPEDSFGAALQYFTGSKEHNIVMRRRAQERNLKLNEYGLFPATDEDQPAVAGRTEEEIYAALDLPWIPPELRENRGEFERAEKHELPELLTLADIQGDLHMHTTATDGAASIREMIEAARARGLSYIAITDHSKRVTMANGLNAQRLRKHWEEIRSIREDYDDIDVLCGIECDILEDATLDLPDDVLHEAEWVIAVLHYGLNQPRDQIQRRLLAAVEHPEVSIIGHPSGRVVGRRPGADIDWQEFLQATRDHGKLLEINASPYRLDLDEVHAAAARELGIPIVISTDAHSTGGLDVMQWGVLQARRAGLQKQDVANTLPAKKFRQLLSRS